MKLVLLQQLFWWVSSSRDICSPEYLLDFRHNNRSYTLLVKRACLPSNFVKLFRQIVEAIEKGEYDGQKHVF